MSETSKTNFLKFYLSLFDLDQSFNRLKQLYAREYGIKPIHILWIYLLFKNPEGLSASSLSQCAHIDKALVSREIQKLVELELVTRTRNGRSNYNSLLKLTEKGIAIAEKTDEIVGGIQEAIYQKIDSEKLAVFYEVSETLTSLFEECSDQLIEDKKNR